VSASWPVCSSSPLTSANFVLQIDYGRDEHGKQILTLTNPEKNILCIGKGMMGLLADERGCVSTS